MMSFIHETLYGLFRDPNKALRAAGLEAGQRVLEVGCGPGFFTIPASRIVGEEGTVVALDVNPLAVEKVQEEVDKAGLTNVEVMLANAAQTHLLDRAFDLIFLFGLVRPIGDMQAIWTELHRILKAEGRLSVEGRLHPPLDLFYLKKSEGRMSRYGKLE
jgi:demethylmenaquinone methyltransferase/2-methoxy-6-polyprenyl-1,4-benzoquinol methylase